MKIYLVRLLIPIAAAFLTVGCSSAAGSTPTRAPRAAAANDSTQTPWIIYVPVTTTPEPSTATSFPTVTGAAPTRSPTQPPPPSNTAAPTRVPPTQAPTLAVTVPPAVSPTLAATAIPTAILVTAAPTATQAPSCGQAYSVSQLTFPENGATRTTAEHPKGNQTIEFMWTPAVPFELGLNIGYQVSMASFAGNGKTQANGAVLFISHNTYLKEKKAILEQNAVYGLTRGDDVIVRWTVTVVMASGGFDDRNYLGIGAITPCGPSTGPFTIDLRIT